MQHRGQGNHKPDLYVDVQPETVNAYALKPPSSAWKDRSQ